MHGLLSTELYLDGCFADFFAFLKRDLDLVFSSKRNVIQYEFRSEASL